MTRTRIPCQQRYFSGRACQRWTHGESEYCRWHQILHDFRRDYAKKPAWASQAVMSGAVGSIVLAGWALYQFQHSPDLLWILVAAFGAGSTIKLFADGVMAREAPLAQFALWGQLLALGLLVEVIAGAIAIWRIVVDPAVSEPLVRLAGADPRWVAIGPRILVVAAAGSTALSLEMFVSRVLFLKVPYLRNVAWIATALAAGWALRPLVPRIAPAQPAGGGKLSFWQPVLGDSPKNALLIAFFAGFVLCELVNVNIRRATGDPELFRKTVWISFPLCVGPPLLGMLLARYGLAAVGVTGTTPFVIATGIPAAVLCVVLTQVVVRRSWHAGSRRFR